MIWTSTHTSLLIVRSAFHVLVFLLLFSIYLNPQQVPVWIIRGHGACQKKWFIIIRNSSLCRGPVLFELSTICSKSTDMPEWLHKESLFEVFRLYLWVDILLQSAAVHDHYGTFVKLSAHLLLFSKRDIFAVHFFACSPLKKSDQPNTLLCLHCTLLNKVQDDKKIVFGFLFWKCNMTLSGHIMTL